MTNRNLKQRIKATLYALKQQYKGGPVSVYTFSGTTTDSETGEKVVNKDVTVVRQVIILPAKVSREVVQSISQISANKAFVYGGSFDSRARTFIFDRTDIPGLVIKDDDWLVFRGRKYEIKNIQEFEDEAAYVIVGRQIIGEVPEQIHLLSTDHLLDLSQSATHTP